MIDDALLQALYKKAEKYHVKGHSPEDLVQQACLRLLEAKTRWEGLSQERTLKYAYTVLYHVVVDCSQEKGVLKKVAPLEDACASEREGTPLEELVRREDRAFLERMFETIPRGALARDCMYEGTQEVAVKYDITRATVRWRLFEFREKARKKVLQYLNGPRLYTNTR